jgi:hypothetical protein
MIDTILGPLDEANLACETVAFDGPQYYAYERRYRQRGDEQVIARYHDVKWDKRNEFLDTPAVIDTKYGPLATALLEKRTGSVDNATEWNCWVEYRPLGGDDIVQRSATVKLKIPPPPITITPGNL